MMANPRIASSSPFYSKAYGGYSKSQIEYLRRQCPDLAGKRVYDPMSGQAFELSLWPYEGADLYLTDIDPTMSILAMMRSPAIITNRHALALALRQTLKKIHRRKVAVEDQTFVTGWFPEPVLDDLRHLADCLSIDIFNTPYSSPSDFWSNQSAIFSIGIVLLAARNICCFRGTDNQTWLRAGSRPKTYRIYEPALLALDEWLSYAEHVELYIRERRTKLGNLVAFPHDATNKASKSVPKCDYIITSPPYANRLEYTRMWAPETETLAAICGMNVSDIRNKQIGSTIVKGRSMDMLQRHKLPRQVIQVLENIKRSRVKDSDTYYYPFFSFYAQTLVAALTEMVLKLKKGGRAIVIVRDTTRKDDLFPTGLLVSHTLTKECGLREVDVERKIIHSHVGLIRRNSGPTFYGLAQQEWWMTFQK